MTKRIKKMLILFSTLGESVVDLHYRGKERLIICGICGNETPERLYLQNDCPHCHLGIDYEVNSEGSEERLERFEEQHSEALSWGYERMKTFAEQVLGI